jgi:abhydrolase domain-containing protein 17
MAACTRLNIFNIYECIKNIFTDELKLIDVFFTRTSRRNKIACMFLKTTQDARFTLLFSHGNAVDIGQMCSFYFGLGCRLKCNVFSYDYSGIF